MDNLICQLEIIITYLTLLYDKRPRELAGRKTTTVYELKKIIEGITKVPPKDQKLFNKDNREMEEGNLLQEYGLTSAVAKAQSPALVGLAFRQENGEFEPLELTPYSSPPDLPYVMKASEQANGQENITS
ncbi:elongin-B [Diaphorina citri]|uniref:Elongin-B n=1 Tax=Diaphorina citri TaxID=121845 RepID=A0A1S3D0Q7_DIACI|nr:elongin-B [Diaphorina citri]